MDYELMWKTLKNRIEAKIGSGDKTLHDGTLLQVMFMMNTAEGEKDRARILKDTRV